MATPHSGNTRRVPGRPGQVFRADRPRPLNAPAPIRIEADSTGTPRALVLKGRRRMVEVVQEVWRIDDEWWRADPICRTYFRLVLDHGGQVTVYWDLINESWWIQRA